MKNIRIIIFILAAASLASGCQKQPAISKQVKSAASVITGPNYEAIEPACSYFYFSWAAHAEQNRKYAEALEAYQKALVCDPESSIIKSKIALLLHKTGQKTGAISYLEKQIKKTPEDMEARLMLARLYLLNKQTEKALFIYENIIKDKPDRYDILLKIAHIHNLKGKLEKAEQIYKELIAANQEKYQLTLHLARLYQRMKKIEQAEKNYLTALEINWSAKLVYEIIYFYKINKQFDKLIDLCEEYAQTIPYDEQIQYSLAEGYLEIGKKQKAEEKLFEIREFADNPHEIDLVIAKIRMLDNQFPQAIKILKTLLNGPAASEAGFMLALLYAKDEPEKALKYLNNINIEFSNYPAAVYLKVKILKKIGQIDKAIASIKELTAVEADRRPFLYPVLAHLYQLDHKPEKALQILMEGIEYYPDNGGIYFEAALLMHKYHLEKEAMKAMETAILLQPDHADALNYVGYTWAEQNINLDKALSYLERAAKIKPESSYIQDSLGWVHYRLGNFEQAKKHLEAAVQMDNFDPQSFDHLGDVYKELGNHKAARKAYLKALKNIDDHKKRALILQKLKSLKSF